MSADDLRPESSAPTGTSLADDPVTQSDDAAPPPPDDEQAAGTSGRTRRRLLVVLAGLCALLAVAAVVLGLQLRAASERDANREAVLTAARQSALNLTTIDSRDLDEGVERVLEGATGEFREDFAAQSDSLKELLLENEVVSEGRVLESGLIRADDNTATALVVVDSTVRNTAAPEGRPNTYRMQLELERQDGRWRTSNLQFVG